MWFWWFMLFCTVLTPFIVIIVGYIMQKDVIKEINGVVGYRTSRSMKNIDTWRFAQVYCGRLWWKIGWIMLILSAVIHLLLYHGSEGRIGTIDAILIAIQTTVLCFSVLLTERALKRTFNEEGLRR